MDDGTFDLLLRSRFVSAASLCEQIGVRFGLCAAENPSSFRVIHEPARKTILLKHFATTGNQ